MTISISAHGALVPLSARLLAGQKVLLMNPQTWDEREGRVARVGNGRSGRCEVAIEFAAPSPEFWPLPAPTNSFERNRTTSPSARPAPPV